MNKIDLIIENMEYAKLVIEQAHKDELLDEALAVARSLRELKPEQPDLRKAAEMALDALERGTTGLAIRAIPALRQALAQPEIDTPESHIVKWSIPVDPNNFGEPLAQPEIDYPPECTTPELEVAYAAGWWKALEVQRQQALDKKADNARELGLDYEPEPFEYWNAVEGWVMIDEIRKHFEMVGCGTIYKTAGEGRKPLYTAPPKRPWVGLTDEEMKQTCYEAWSFDPYVIAQAIQEKLRSKNEH